MDKSIFDNEKTTDQNLEPGIKVDGRKSNKGGRQPGSMNKATMETKVAKKRFIERVNAHVDDLFNAQLSLAQGEQVLMVQVTEGEGKNQKRYHEVVEDKETIKQYLDWNEGIGDNEDPSDDKHWYYLTTRAANNQAIDSLLNRSFGKAPEKMEIEGGLFTTDKLTIEIVKSKLAKDIEEADQESSEG